MKIADGIQKITDSGNNEMSKNNKINKQENEQTIETKKMAT